MRRRIGFWLLVVLAAVLFTDPILSIQDILGYNSFGTDMTYPNSWIQQDFFFLHSYALRFYDPRSSVASWMLVATIIGLGALAGAVLKFYGKENEKRPVLVTYGVFLAIVTASAFRGAEVLTEMLMVQGICLGDRAACPGNEAIPFWNGDRFTVIAYLCLGVAIVVGGVLAKKGWHRFVAPPPSPAPAAVVATEPALNAAAEKDTAIHPDNLKLCQQVS
mgnify:CR=1 FL=1